MRRILMTQYQYKSRISKSMCLELENLYQELQFYKQKFYIDKLEQVQYDFDMLKIKLNILWGEQMDILTKLESYQEEDIDQELVA